MTDRIVTISLPDELMNEIETSNINVQDVVKDALQRELERSKARERFLQVARDLRSIPDELKPTLEEIDAAVRQARAELRAEREAARSKT